MYSIRIQLIAPCQDMKVTTVRFDEDVLSRLDGLARETKRSRNWLIQEAVGRYLDYEVWFVDQVRVGLEDVEEGRTVPHDQVMAEVREKIAKAGT